MVAAAALLGYTDGSLPSRRIRLLNDEGHATAMGWQRKTQKEPRDGDAALRRSGQMIRVSTALSDDRELIDGKKMMSL